MPTAEQQAFAQRMQRIEALINELGSSADPSIRPAAEELVQSLLELHGAGIERMLDLLWESGAAGQALVETTLPADELVGSLLLLHDLHPLDLETRVGQALERVRPYLASHGGNVELLGIDAATVKLRLQGSCNGCASSELTLKYAIEDAIYGLAPDVVAIEVEGVVPPPTRPRSASPDIIPLTLESGRPGASAPAGAWVTVNHLVSLAAGAYRTDEVAGQPVFFCRVAETLYAYSADCPRCQRQLAHPTLAASQLRCDGCGHRFDVMRAGRDLDEPLLHLDPIPLLAEHGQFKVALPALGSRAQ